jgi:hypothetical protein
MRARPGRLTSLHRIIKNESIVGLTAVGHTALGLAKK